MATRYAHYRPYKEMGIKAREQGLGLPDRKMTRTQKAWFMLGWEEEDARWKARLERTKSL